MAPRIVIIGGGSNQWAPSLLNDIANTRSLDEAEIVLEDINPEPLPRMAEYAEHLARLRNIAWKVSYTTDQRGALEGADFVVVAISTGGFDSMRHDVEIPARYGIRLSVGDAGPGGREPNAARRAGDGRHRPRHGRDLPRRVDAQPHQPDDAPRARDDARDLGEGGRAVPRGDDLPLLPVDVARRELPRPRADGRGREPPPDHDEA